MSLNEVTSFNEPGGAAIRTTATIASGDIQIGAVELKNGADDTRAKIAAGNTVAAADPALATSDANVKADTALIATSIQLIDDMVGTTGAAVPTKTTLLAGTNAGNLQAVTVSATGGISVGTTVPGTAATNLGKAVDNVVGATDTGIAQLSKRVDSLATITPANGDYAVLQVDNQGSLWVRNSVSQATSYSKSNITTATTSTPKSGPGMLHAIIVNLPVASGVITIYDNTAASGTVIATITYPATLLSSGPVAIPYNSQISTGITVVTSAAFNITVMYS